MTKQNPKNSPAEPVEDTGEFAGFDGFGPFAAYLHHKYGEAALREVFKRLRDDEQPMEKETFEDTATELENRGLDKPAAVLRGIAESAVSGIDMVPDYMVNAGPQFVESWRRRWLQNRQRKLGTFEQELRRTITRNQRQSQANTQKPSPTQH